jgi:nucleoside-diphosphate-sugar epimerase
MHLMMHLQANAFSSCPSAPCTCLCRAVNVPAQLLDAMHRQYDSTGGVQHGADIAMPLLIHLSTDQVYSGSHAMSTEAAVPAPVNVYGASKLQAEHTIQARWPRHVILRSSIIYGPQAPAPVARPLFVQFVVRS